MPTYVSLVKFSQQGLQTMKDKGVERAEMVKKNARSDLRTVQWHTLIRQADLEV